MNQTKTIKKSNTFGLSKNRGHYVVAKRGTGDKYVTHNHTNAFSIIIWSELWTIDAVKIKYSFD